MGRLSIKEKSSNKLLIPVLLKTVLHSIYSPKIQNKCAMGLGARKGRKGKKIDFVFVFISYPAQLIIRQSSRIFLRQFSYFSTKTNVTLH